MFEQHGIYKLTLDKLIVRLEAFDAWNIEAAKALVSDYHKLLHQGSITNEQWASLVILNDWFPTFESLPILTELNEHAIQNGLRFEAIVGQQELAKSLIMEKIVGKGTEVFTRKTFTSVDDAQAWLTDNLLRR